MAAASDTRPGQARFVAALLDPAAPPPEGLSPTADGRAPEKRFAVYRNNVVVSLSKALKAGFPTVALLVGDEFFDALAGAYVRENPPRTPILMFYGETFGDWLAQFPPAAQLPYLPDVARLDQARREAYHAADAEPVGRAAFEAALAGPAEALEGLRAELHPALRLVASPYPILSIFHRARDPEAPVAEAAETALVARPERDLQMRAAPPGCGAFLARLAAGAPFGEAAAAATEADMRFQAAECIGLVIAMGLATSLSSNL